MTRMTRDICICYSWLCNPLVNSFFFFNSNYTLPNLQLSLSVSAAPWWRWRARCPAAGRPLPWWTVRGVPPRPEPRRWRTRAAGTSVCNTSAAALTWQSTSAAFTWMVNGEGSVDQRVVGDNNYPFVPFCPPNQARVHQFPVLGSAFTLLLQAWSKLWSSELRTVFNAFIRLVRAT